MRRIRTEREGAAPAEAAWDRVSDISSYRERNPRVVDGGGRFEDANGGRREAGA
ncbi:hypothetical protein C474_09594 [Halogeometricum pallidum JCM 14848]|uniref:Uncharacterized protein n=1 Tax=Halogeometricum pallidum JCM 14848 TaxID=1227487 RepID=M0D8D4_HALPD|nr:hypothetical protein [Halogeometricum pallidum]ELZ31078.1 hypothetical protein C474_09594 [Halogeometricum pallidum JCM 14848]